MTSEALVHTTAVVRGWPGCDRMTHSVTLAFGGLWARGFQPALSLQPVLSLQPARGGPDASERLIRSPQLLGIADFPFVTLEAEVEGPR